MNTLDFLKTVWPDSGIYLVLTPTSGIDRTTGKPWKSYRHFAHLTIEAAAQHALDMAYYHTPADVYFALGTVKEDLTKLKKEDREALGKKVRGLHKSGYDNTQSIKCFWLDIDVKADPKAYATVAEAAQALRDFCHAMQLPKPLVTSSGGGLHVYWPLTTALDPGQWAHYAGILKQLTVSWRLRADPSRTSDRASILRPVGTFNLKTGVAREVKVVMNGGVVDTKQFTDRLSYLAETAGLPPVQVHQQPLQLGGVPLQLTGQPIVAPIAALALNEAAAAGLGYEKADPRKVVAKCAQLSWQAANQNQVPEPLWYAMIGCLRHAKDGAKAVHFMSRLAADYNAADTDMKIRQHEEGGYPPTTCSKFESENPAGCSGCPFKGKIKTPLQLVREMEQVAPPTIQAFTQAGAQAIQLPPVPAPFKRVANPMTGQTRLAMTIDNDGQDLDVVIYEYDFYPVRLVLDERTNTRRVVVQSWLPQDGTQEFEVPMGDFYDKRNLAKTLGNLGIMPDLGHVESVVSYMIAYIRDLQKAARSSTIYAQLGWRPEHDEFILPDRIVTATASQPITVSRNFSRALSWREAKGDLDTWKKVAATYEAPGMEAHQFGFGVGFASPLFIHTNYNGMIVSMVGKRGAGKSSSAMLANSIWGHPKMGWGDMEHDTLRAFYNKLGVLNNLPATYDEHTNLDPDIVSDLCYMVSKGQGRSRLTNTGEAAENHGNFNLIMLMTGNTSLNARLASAKADSSAESARVFEYNVPQNTMSKVDADALFGTNGLLFNNFGVASELYVRQLLISQDWAKERVLYWVQEVDRLAKVSSGERFWSAGVACVLTGFELANQCGLTNADIPRLLAFAVKTINGMREIVSENTRTSNNIIADYLNNNLRSVLVLDSAGTAAMPARISHLPTYKLCARLERYSNTLYIDRADFKRYCSSLQMDANSVLIELIASGVVLDKMARITLGRGTQLKMAQTVCWKLDLNHPSMLGVGELAQVQDQTAVAQRPAVTGHLHLQP